VSVPRDDEQRRRVEEAQERRRVIAAGHGGAGLGFELVEHGCVQEEALHYLGLARQHLFHEVVTHDPHAARELGEESVRIDLVAQRDRRHLHTGRPSVGALGENPRRVDREVGAERPHQFVHLVECES